MRQLAIAIDVGDESLVGEVRRAAVRLAEHAGFGTTAAGAVAVVATELATNLARYATGGRVFLQLHPGEGGPQVELLAVDAGPGIDDPARCLQDGYSTTSSQGIGLGAIRRLSAEFDIHSVPGQGTVLLARVGARAPLTRFAWAGLSTCAPGEVVCGDAWRVEMREDAVAVLVADGLGHGVLAAEAADAAVRAFEEDPFSRPAATCTRVHKALTATRGAAVAMGLAAGGRLRYAGIGNISGVCWRGGAQRGLASQNGTAGLHGRTPQEFDYDWSGESLLIMHSDGLTNRWRLDAQPGLAARHPAIIAGVLHRDALRGRDDASVVVVRETATFRAEGGA